MLGPCLFEGKPSQILISEASPKRPRKLNFRKVISRPTSVDGISGKGFFLLVNLYLIDMNSRFVEYHIKAFEISYVDNLVNATYLGKLNGFWDID